MILVTRPSPEGEVLTQHLKQANLSVKHLPFFSISIGRDLFNLQNELNKLAPADIVIVLSPQVAHIIKTYTPNLFLPSFIRYFAIGHRSAELFSQLTHTEVNYPEQEDSEGLLQLLECESLTNRTILILRGNSGRELLAKSLIKKKANIKLLECYCRKQIVYPLGILDDNIDEQIIIITSIEHLLQLERYCHTDHKNQANLIVCSKRIFEKAKQLKWQKVLQVESANNQILFRTMITLCHNATIFPNKSK